MLLLQAKHSEHSTREEVAQEEHRQEATKDLLSHLEAEALRQLGAKDRTNCLSKGLKADEKTRDEILTGLLVVGVSQFLILLYCLKHLRQHWNTDEAATKAHDNESNEDKDGLILALNQV